MLKIPFIPAGRILSLRNSVYMHPRLAYDINGKPNEKAISKLNEQNFQKLTNDLQTLPTFTWASRYRNSLGLFAEVCKRMESKQLENLSKDLNSLRAQTRYSSIFKLNLRQIILKFNESLRIHMYGLNSIINNELRERSSLKTNQK